VLGLAADFMFPLWWALLAPSHLNATLTSITVDLSNPSIDLGAGEEFTAVGNFNEGTTQTLRNFAVWSSSNTAVAIIGPAGVGDIRGHRQHDD
jgi:hypothetical protein